MTSMQASKRLLKLWSEHKGYSQSGIGTLSGVNRIQIGAIKDCKKTGSVSTLKKLAGEVDIQMDGLVTL